MGEAKAREGDRNISQRARGQEICESEIGRDQEMLLALIIGAAAVVAFICSFATFLQYMREEADDDGNSNAPPA